MIAATKNAAGGKGPCGGRVDRAGKRFNQLDSYVWRRLRRLRIARKGRNLKPGEAKKWTREYFWKLGLHRLRGTVRYPEVAQCGGTN